MLVLEIFRYLKRRADKRPIRLSNFVPMAGHHGKRAVDPKVSIIIPTRDKYELLRACVESIQTKTVYGNYEIMVINNGSSETTTIEYLELLRSTGITVLDYPYAFNYSKISNFGADNTDSEYLCFLNNDTEVIEPNWLGYLIDHAIQPNVGVVGSKLLYPDHSIQHMGVALGYTGAAGHPFAKETPATWSKGNIEDSCFEVSCVTFACAVTSKQLFIELSGMDPSLKVGLNDIDFCLRAASISRRSVVCGKSCLTHFESMSRPKPISLAGFRRGFLETVLFLNRYGALKDKFFSQDGLI